MRIDQITPAQLEYIDNLDTFGPKALKELEILRDKIVQTTSGRKLSMDGLVGVSVGIKMGLVLAEAEALEKLVGIK